MSRSDINIILVINYWAKTILTSIMKFHTYCAVTSPTCQTNSYENNTKLKVREMIQRLYYRTLPLILEFLWNL